MAWNKFKQKLIEAELAQPSGLLDFAYYERMYKNVEVDWVDFAEKYILNPGKYMASPYKCSRISCGASVKREQHEYISKFYPSRTCAELMAIYKEGIAKDYDQFKVGMRGKITCRDKASGFRNPGRFIKIKHLVETFCKDSLLPGNTASGEFGLDDDDYEEESALDQHLEELYEQGIGYVQEQLEVSDDISEILSSSFETFGMFQEIKAWRKGNPGESENTNFEVLKVNYIKYGPFYDTGCSKAEASTEFEERGSMSYCGVVIDMAKPASCPQLCNKPSFDPCGESYFAQPERYGTYDKFQALPEAATVRHMLERRIDAINLLCGFNKAQEREWDDTKNHYEAKSYYMHFFEYFMPSTSNMEKAYRSNLIVESGKMSWTDLFEETRREYLRPNHLRIENQNPGVLFITLCCRCKIVRILPQKLILSRMPVSMTI